MRCSKIVEILTLAHLAIHDRLLDLNHVDLNVLAQVEEDVLNIPSEKEKLAVPFVDLLPQTVQVQMNATQFEQQSEN